MQTEITKIASKIDQVYKILKTTETDGLHSYAKYRDDIY